MISSVRLSTKDITTNNYNDVIFDSISYDSRKAQENSLFFVKGAAFKKEFLLSAIEQGLGWYVAEQDYEVGIPVIVVSDIKKAMSFDCHGILW